MPKIAKALSAAQVARLTAPGLYAVGGVPGLQMQVTPTGSRSWVLRVLVGSKRRDIGMGSVAAVTLAQARERAREARAKVWEGIDPVAERKAARLALIATQGIPTFDECAKRFLASKTAEFKSAKHADQWRSTLETYASPVIGRLPVNQIGLDHIVSILTKDDLWTTKTETASRLRGRIESVLAWATVSKYRTGDNPAHWRGHLDAVLAKPGKLRQVKHFAALPYAEIPKFIADLRQRKGVAARALEFAIMTAARSGEVRGAVWGEFDLDAGVWSIPEARMKAGKAHEIPLAPSVVETLKAIRDEAEKAAAKERKAVNDSDHVFPAANGGALSDMALTKVLRDMDVRATAHGMRSAFRDWAGEATNFPREVIEHALAHQLKDKAEAAYQRGTLFPKRRKLMEAWARYGTTPRPDTATVTPINRNREVRV